MTTTTPTLSLPHAASQAELFATLPPEEAEQLVACLTDEEAASLQWDWRFWARHAQQIPEGDWGIWLILAGRGYGKTRTGAETIRRWACGSTPLDAGTYKRFAIVGETAADVRDVLVEGPSGLLAVHPPDFRPLYEPSKRRLTWPNGAWCTTFNATEPDALRGPEHDCAWSDELAKWRYLRDTWDMLQFGLRAGDRPRQIITTTPRPIALLKDIMSMSETVTTGGSTHENLTNLAPSFLKTIVRRYEGTRLGRQELNAEILDDIPGALWTRERIDASRKPRGTTLPDMVRMVVGVDPSGTRGDRGDEIGIVVGGKGSDGHVYILDDQTCRLGPAKWGERVVLAYDKHQCDSIVAEINFGGAMVEQVIRTAARDLKIGVTYREVKASRGKIVRAEPVSALYTQGRVHHVGAYAQLEDQLVNFTPDGYMGDGSPDRADALVWVVTTLLLGDSNYDASMGWV